MRAARPQIECDFVARNRAWTSLSLGLLALGAALLIVALAVYMNLDARRSGLQLRLAALRRGQTALLDSAVADARLSPGIEQAAQDLATPWTVLFAELEKASKESAGQVAVLGVEPDHAKHSVRISAESRDLPLALAYVQRLQGSRSIQYPMLERHELRADDPQHPVRFEVTGQWRDQL
jgi:hypothetical protein